MGGPWCSPPSKGDMWAARFARISHIKCVQRTFHFAHIFFRNFSTHTCPAHCPTTTPPCWRTEVAGRWTGGGGKLSPTTLGSFLTFLTHSHFDHFSNFVDFGNVGPYFGPCGLHPQFWENLIILCRNIILSWWEMAGKKMGQTCLKWPRSG